MKIKEGTLPVVLFLSVPILSFVYDGIFDKRSMVIFALIASLILTGEQRFPIADTCIHWFLYMAAVCLSVMQRPVNRDFIEEILIFLLMMVFALHNKYSWDALFSGYILIVLAGILNGCMVILQFLLKDRFNSLVWPFYVPQWQEYMARYYSENYYSGIHPVPGDTAGIIVFSLCIMIIFLLAERNTRHGIFPVWRIPIFALLVLSILLTGKKGVALAGILGLALIATFLLGRKGSWGKIFLLAAILIIGFLCFRSYVLAHEDNVILSRISEFFKNVSEGEEFDSGRSVLYGFAIEQWRSRPLLGIGWRRFREMTMLVYGYENMHDVNLDYLQLLCETGVIGAVLIFSVITVNLVRTFKVLKKLVIDRDSIRKYGTIVTAAFIQFFTLIYACLEIPFYDRRFFFPMYVYSAVCISKQYAEITFSPDAAIPGDNSKQK